MFRTIPTLLVLALSATTTHSLPNQKRDQCAAILATAVSSATTLQNHYWNAGSGQYNGGSLWTDANTLEDLHNLMLATGTNEFSAVADQSYIGRSAAAYPNTNWAALLNGSNDDSLWVILALWKMADYKSSRGLPNSGYLNSAAQIYNLIEAQWDGVCGGGGWWSTAKTYKNAVTNELYLLVSSEGYIRGGGQTYLTNAKNAWAWISNSGMRNGQGLYNDGLTSTCGNNGQQTWIYNQGVIAAGLGSLYAATGDASLLTQAEITLDATIALKTTNNILRESCDDTVGSDNVVCNADQQIFKGIWVKHLQFYLDRANDPARNAKYAGFLHAQASAIFHYGTNAANDIGSVWYAGSQGGSVFTPKSSASGLAAYVGSAKYGTCSGL